MVRRSLEESIIGIIGQEQTLFPPEIDDYTIDGRNPSVVAFPKGTEELSEILKVADSEGDAIIPWGGGTKMSLGNSPTRVDCVVSTKYLDKVSEYDSDDLTITLQSGVVMDNLQKTLAAKNQFLALDPTVPLKATLGGIVATNSSGPRRLAYGSVRDMLLGIKVVHPGGEISKGGGKVVKNVAGYDMQKLYIGSLGTLGIILEMTFKVKPLPDVKGTIMATFNSSQQALKSAYRVLTSNIQPTAVEFLNPNTANELLQAGNNLSEVSYTLAISLEGISADVSRQKVDVVKIAKHSGASEHVFLENQNHEDFWRQLSNLPEVMEEAFQNIVLCKISLLNSKVKEMIHMCEHTASKYGVQNLTYAHAGSGIVYIYLLTKVLGVDELKKLSSIIMELRDAASLYDGNLVLQKAPVKIKEKSGVWGHVSNELFLMKALRDKFDPNGTLNPGRFVVGK